MKALKALGLVLAVLVLSFLIAIAPLEILKYQTKMAILQQEYHTQMMFLNLQAEFERLENVR
jgi:hypothetical protein